jgi:hypothetical protein
MVRLRDSFDQGNFGNVVLFEHFFFLLQVILRIFVLIVLIVNHIVLNVLIIHHIWILILMITEIYIIAMVLFVHGFILVLLFFIVGWRAKHFWLDLELFVLLLF